MWSLFEVRIQFLRTVYDFLGGLNGDLVRVGRQERAVEDPMPNRICCP